MVKENRNLTLLRRELAIANISADKMMEDLVDTKLIVEIEELRTALNYKPCMSIEQFYELLKQYDVKEFNNFTINLEGFDIYSFVKTFDGLFNNGEYSYDLVKHNKTVKNSMVISTKENGIIMEKSDVECILPHIASSLLKIKLKELRKKERLDSQNLTDVKTLLNQLNETLKFLE